MRTHVAVVTVEDLVEFLKRDGRDANSKDYEFHTALVLARFMSKQLGGNRMRVAFPARRERASELYDHRTDPDETINRAGDAALAVDRSALARRLARQFPPRALPSR